MTEIQLRPAQKEILKYQNGRMAISAVPGSGKTFTLSLLAAQLIRNGRIDPDANQQILIVTYLNASVDTFRARIRQRLEAFGLPPDTGYDVRTLHSLSLEIVRQAEASLGGDELLVLDEGQSGYYLSLAIDAWKEEHPELWAAFLPDTNPQTQTRWRSTVESTARALIRTAKNERITPQQILAKLQNRQAHEEDASVPLLEMAAGIYGRYQSMLTRQGARDFDDLIWHAVDLLEQNPDFVQTLRQQWPYVLEDEAQDSVPLQETLLTLLTGEAGNWVRVGDPNQAITSTFTAAHPRFFNAFLDEEDVLALPLPNSGRSAPLIIGAANTMLNWVIDEHPVPEVRRHTFRRQEILPTPPGDAQPNPPNSEAAIRFKVYKHREDEELPGVAKAAVHTTIHRPNHTVAILVPTNSIGHAIADILDELDANYDNLLRGGGREREIAAAMHAVLNVLAEPTSAKALAAAHASLNALGHPAALVPDDGTYQKLQTLLKSIHKPELFLFPWEEDDVYRALPANIASAEEMALLEKFAAFMQGLFRLRPLPIDDLALALGDELFAYNLNSDTPTIHEADLAIAYHIATTLRQWRDIHPDWRLPDLAAELDGIATGRRTLPTGTPDDYGYEPQPGRITLTTQHKAKGLEWDTVFLVGIDGTWLPGSLDAYFMGVSDIIGGDPTAEVMAQLRYVMFGDAGLYPGRTATESAHIDIISERLRLLYVGITRAKRHLYFTRSRATRTYAKDREAKPATVMGVIFKYLKSQQEGEN